MSLNKIPTTFKYLFHTNTFVTVAAKFGQGPCAIVQGISSQMTRREFFIFIIFLMHIHVLMLH